MKFLNYNYNLKYIFKLCNESIFLNFKFHTPKYIFKLYYIKYFQPRIKIFQVQYCYVSTHFGETTAQTIIIILSGLHLLVNVSIKRARSFSHKKFIYVSPMFIDSAGDFTSFFSDSTMLPNDGRSLGSLPSK